MIPNDKKHKARMQHASFIPKPKGSLIWWGEDCPNPEQMGLHQMQKKNSKRKKKR
jgi:hypothetical protein